MCNVRALAKIGIKEAVPELLEHLFYPIYKDGNWSSDKRHRYVQIEDLGTLSMRKLP